MSWLSGWDYRKSHVINYAADAGTGYQVSLTVHYGSGSDSGDDVYLGSKCRTDFGDIRFTDDDGSTELDYWMEEKTDSDYAKFWVKINDDLSSSAATIYVYYGNAGASSSTSGEDTFVYFEDFTGAEISYPLTVYESNADKAHIYLDTENDILVAQAMPSGMIEVALAYFPTVACGHAIRTRTKRTVNAPENNVIYTVAFNGEIAFQPYNQVGENSYCHDAATHDRIGYRFSRNGTATSGYPTDRNLDTWEVIDVYWDSNYAKLLLEGSSLGSTTNTSYIPPTSLYPAIGLQSGTGYTQDTNEKYFDWVAVRKYTYPEPSHGSWGNEKEEAPADAEAGFEAGDTSEFCDTETSNGSITATDAVAHHGTYSCKCDVNADGNAYAEGYFDILEQEPVYCRGYFRFNQLPETNRDYTIISFENTDGPTTLGYVQLINDGGTKKWKIRRTTGGGAAYSTSTSNIPAVNTWVCVEFAHGENLAKLWVDGDELLTHADAIDQNIDRVHVGACSSDMDADNTLEIHVDCISVTDEYVGVETDLEVTNLAVNKVATLASAKSNNIILEYDYEHITISDLHLPTEDMPYKTYTDLDEEYGNIIFKHTGEADQDHQYPPYDKGRFGNFYLVMVQDPENNSIYQPIIATERGLWVEKDIQTYGVVMISTDPVKAGGGGAIMIGHGFTGPTCPPEIRLSESDLVNLVSHSENFGNAYWTGYPTNKDNITNNPADDEFKAPDNEKTAWKIVCDADCSGVVSSLIPFTAGPDYTLSVWLKGNAESEGEVVKIGIVGWVEEAVTLTTYWKRHKVSFISPGTSQRYLRFYKESSSGTYYAWGTQLTQSNIYRSYVPTTDGPNAPFDTLHITDRFGSNPANMDLGNLTANQINVDEIKTKAEGTYVWDLANMPNQGTSGYVLMAQGPGNAPVWASVDGGGPHTHVADDITSGTFDYDDVSFANQNMNQSDHPTFGSVTGTSTDAGLKAGNPNYFAVGIDGPDVFVTSFGDYHLRLSTAQNNKNVVIAPHGTGELDCNCNVDANSYGIGGTNIVTAGRVLQNVTMDASLLTGSITVDGGDVNVNSNLSVSDELDVTGLASFGNIQLSGEVASNLVPSGTSGTRYLGSSSKAWNFYLASGYIGSARFTAYCVPDNSGVNLGTAADPWNEVFAQTYKYHTTGALVYFDSLDDLGIIRNSKSMKVVGNDGIERDMVSLEGGMECVLADGSNKFASASKVNGLLFGAIKQLIAKVEALEADIKKIPREKTTTKQKGAA